MNRILNKSSINQYLYLVDGAPQATINKVRGFFLSWAQAYMFINMAAASTQTFFEEAP